MEAKGIRGWLLVFCLILLVWQPVSLGLLASRVVDSIAVRGISLGLVLILRLGATAFGIAAGLAVLAERPFAIRMAKASLWVSAAVDLFVYLTPYFPNNRIPGDTPLYVVASVAYYGIWLMYLVRSRRVRNTFGD